MADWGFCPDTKRPSTTVLRRPPHLSRVRHDGLRSVRTSRVIQGHRQVSLVRCGHILQAGAGNPGTASPLRARQSFRVHEIQASISAVRSDLLSRGPQSDSTRSELNVIFSSECFCSIERVGRIVKRPSSDVRRQPKAVARRSPERTFKRSKADSRCAARVCPLTGGLVVSGRFRPEPTSQQSTLSALALSRDAWPSAVGKR